MDEIVIIRSDSTSITSLKSFLHNQFHTKDLETLKYFLGVEVMRNKQGILLSQRKYVFDLLYETAKLGAKPCSTHMAPYLQFTKEGELFEVPERYERLVGKSKLSYSNSLGYCLFSKCFESVYIISHSQSLGNCRAYPMLLERSSWTWNIV